MGNEGFKGPFKGLVKNMIYYKKVRTIEICEIEKVFDGYINGHKQLEWS